MSSGSHIKTLLSDSVVYGLTGMLNRFITMFFIPVYSRILIPADYGEMNLINMIFMAVSIIVVCGFDGASMRWYYNHEDSAERIKGFASWFWFQLALLPIITLLLFFCTPIISSKFFEHDVKELFIIQIANLFFALPPLVMQIYYRAKREPRTFLITSLGGTLLTIMFTLLFLLVFRLGIKGVFGATLCSNIIVTIYAFYKIGNVLHWRNFEWPRTKEMLQYSLPLIPTSLSFWLLNGSGNFFVKGYTNIHEAGLYAIGVQIGAAVALVTTAFQLAWSAFAFSIKDDPNAKNTYALVLTLYMCVSCTLALTVSLFSKEALAILTVPSYYPAYSVGCFFAFHAIAVGLSYIAFTGISIVKTTSPYARAVLISSTICIVLYVLLIPIWKKEGAAIATLIGYTLIPILVFRASQKVYPIPYKFGVAAMVYVVAAAGACSIIFFEKITLLNIIMKSAIVCAYMIMCMNVVRSLHRAAIDKLWQTMKSKIKFGEK